MRALAFLVAVGLLLLPPAHAGTRGHQVESRTAEPPGSVGIYRLAGGEVVRISGGYLLPSPAGDGGWLVVAAIALVPREGSVAIKSPGGTTMFAVQPVLQDARTGLAFLRLVEPKPFEAQLEGEDVPPLADAIPVAGETLLLPGGRDPAGSVIQTAKVGDVDVVKTTVRIETTQPVPVISAGRTVVGYLGSSLAGAGPGDLVSAAYVRALLAGPGTAAAEPAPGEAPNRPAADPNRPPSIVRVSGGVLGEKARTRVPPSYPGQVDVEGAVVVEVTVGEDGRVVSARAISGHPLLRDAAVAAARQWEFAPTRLSGVPVKVVGTITFNFRRS